MGGLFSKKKPAQPNRITEQDKAVLSLKQQRDKLKQYQKKITLNLEKERQVAKALLKEGKKEKAKLLLKKKHYQENLLQKTDGQLENIDKLISEVEFKQVELKVVEGLKQGNEALKKLNDLMKIEDVELIMEETREAAEYQNEISSLIGSSLSQEDEDDILRELEELTQVEELPSVPTDEPSTIDDQLPDVPETEPTSARKKEKKDADDGRIAVAAS